MSQGLIFQNKMGEKQLNVYTDASYSEVSFGCHLILWGSSLLLWKAGKQPIQAASTAEAELVEVLEGALAGDAVKVVLEEALDVCARSFSYTDSSAALATIAGNTGSWRTRHLRKRAFILRSKVLAGEWMIRHLPGAEMPADLGTKVLSVQKFNQHKETMGMFLGNLENLKKAEDGEQTETPSGMTPEAKERALKIIILVTKLSLAGASMESEKGLQTALVVPDLNPVLQQSDSQFYFILFVAVILLPVSSLGHVSWASSCGTELESWPWSDTRVHWWMCQHFCGMSKKETRKKGISAKMINLPGRLGFQRRLLEALREALRALPPRLLEALPALVPRLLEALRALPWLALHPRLLDTLLALHPRLLEALLALHLRLLEALLALAPRLLEALRALVLRRLKARLALEIIYGAAGIPSAAAAGSADGDAAAHEPAIYLRSRGSRSQRGPKPLFTTPFGGKHHCDRECHGLRHAREICLTPRCHRCGPQSDIPRYELYVTSHGYALHVDYEHCRDVGSNGPIRAFNPCAICCTVEDRFVERDWARYVTSTTGHIGGVRVNTMDIPPYLPNFSNEIQPPFGIQESEEDSRQEHTSGPNRSPF